MWAGAKKDVRKVNLLKVSKKIGPTGNSFRGGEFDISEKAIMKLKGAAY